MKYKIEKNVEVPKVRPKWMDAGFPLEDMEIGDSFLIPASDAEEIKKSGTFVGQANTYHKARHKGKGSKPKRFIRKTTAEGMRVWRES